MHLKTASSTISFATRASFISLSLNNSSFFSMVSSFWIKISSCTSMSFFKPSIIFSLSSSSSFNSLEDVSRRRSFEVHSFSSRRRDSTFLFFGAQAVFQDLLFALGALEIFEMLSGFVSACAVAEKSCSSASYRSFLVLFENENVLLLSFFSNFPLPLLLLPLLPLPPRFL